jgi:hypothetical protein
MRIECSVSVQLGVLADWCSNMHHARHCCLLQLPGTVLLYDVKRCGTRKVVVLQLRSGSLN